MPSFSLDAATRRASSLSIVKHIHVRNKPRHVRTWRVSGRIVDGARVRARVCVHRPGQVRRVESR